MIKIEVCPGNLSLGFDKYSPSCIKKLFGGKRVSHILDFSYDADNSNLFESINQISVSGVQEKLSAIVGKGKIVMTPRDQQGHYIIKPAPNYKYLRFRDQIPANEHLTMQIAKQVYKINTAENGLIFFSKGEVAYITKRFDFDNNGLKIKQEDFSSLAQKTSYTHGENYKYTGSYEDAAYILKNSVSAWQVEMSKFFTLVIFNYLFSNGDAHLKNFSLQQSTNGDYLFTPAYDLMNTSLHVNDDDFALQGGLFSKQNYSSIYERTGHPCIDDFVHLGVEIGLPDKIIKKSIAPYLEKQPMVQDLIQRSFLDEKLKRMYLKSYEERLSRLQRTEK